MQNEIKPILNPDGDIIHMNVAYYNLREKRAKELGEPSPWVKWGVLGVIPKEHISNRPEAKWKPDKTPRDSTLPLCTVIPVHELGLEVEVQFNSVRNIGGKRL